MVHAALYLPEWHRGTAQRGGAGGQLATGCGENQNASAASRHNRKRQRTLYFAAMRSVMGFIAASTCAVRSADAPAMQAAAMIHRTRAMVEGCTFKTLHWFGKRE